jgi:TBC1 domain family member 15
VDKKQNFPKPRTPRQSSSSSTPQADSEGSSATSNGKAKEDTAPKVISPELRKLLSREVEILPRNVVQKKGDGLAADLRR